MHFYDEWAQRILHGHFTEYAAFYGLPLYAYFLALLYKLFGYGPFIPGFLQAAAEAGTAVLLYKIATRVFARGETKPETRDTNSDVVLSNHGQLIGLLSGVGWALFVPAQTYAVILMPTSYLVFVFWLVVWWSVRTDSAPSRRECLFIGLLLGSTAMAVATILFLLPLIVILIVKREIGKRQWNVALCVALLLAGVGLGSSPAWLHNYFVARDPVFLSAHSGINFWIGNNPTANGYPKFPPGLRASQTAMLEDSITQAEAAAGHPLKRAEVSAYWSKKARHYITAHFVEWSRLIALKVRNFWNAFQYDDLSVITNLREGGVTFPGPYFGLVAALAFPGMLLGWWFVPRSRWITAAVLLQMLALLPVFVTERYRLAAAPGLLLFAAFGLSMLWQACATTQFRLATVYCVLLAASAVAVSLPQRDPSLWALDTYNSGWQAFEGGNLPLAEQKLQLAYAYVPENAEINFALGNLRLAQRRTNEAKSYYFATLRLDPTHGGGYNNLGVLALQEERWSLAARFFEKALKQDPSDAKIHYLLAEAQFRSGDLLRAKDEITEALKLNPKQPEFAELRRQIEEHSE